MEEGGREEEEEDEGGGGGGPGGSSKGARGVEGREPREVQGEVPKKVTLNLPLLLSGFRCCAPPVRACICGCPTPAFTPTPNAAMRYQNVGSATAPWWYSALPESDPTQYAHCTQLHASSIVGRWITSS